MNPSDVAEVLGRLAAWWPNFKNTPGVTTKHYTVLFNELEATQSEALAALSYLRKSGEKFFPAPDASDIERAVNAVRAAASGVRVKLPEERWELLMIAARHSTPWDVLKPRLTETTEKAITSVGGWQKIRYASFDELPFLRKAFLETFKAIDNADAVHETAKISSLAVNTLVAIAGGRALPEGGK